MRSWSASSKITWQTLAIARLNSYGVSSVKILTARVSLPSLEMQKR